MGAQVLTCSLYCCTFIILLQWLSLSAVSLVFLRLTLYRVNTQFLGRVGLQAMEERNILLLKEAFNESCFQPHVSPQS